MSVIAFSAARFTPADLALFESIADEKLRLGRWASVRRESGRRFDRLEILLPDAPAPVFRFGRGHDGWYRLEFNDRSGWYPLGSGRSAEDCLAIWLPRRRGGRG